MRIGSQRKASDEATVDLTSMLDIVFILLIFFIVTSSFVREAGVDISRPEASHSNAQQDTDFIVAIDASNDLYIDGVSFDIASLHRILANEIGQGDAITLLVQADKNSATGTVIKVMDIAKGLGIEHIAIATQTVQGQD
ncbi:biopolymer transporter ExbD [Alginatibacterium sediminis]|uniref:Biopolymer transporter ExbD n=1 Tax=Alginatibacterium sediminis TaxID=2164068 RepID=A0A420EH44_9ALTE|nr:biopolymer transporter ExbD [Alginatibacterium sediminis]RKF20009.1 biopolymer transporter ExbD [Alginatibacterium sediminis]